MKVITNLYHKWRMNANLSMQKFCEDCLERAKAYEATQEGCCLTKDGVEMPYWINEYKGKVQYHKNMIQK